MTLQVDLLEAPKNDQFVFVNSTQHKRKRDRDTGTQVRRHVMRDIGKNRRKPGYYSRIKVPLEVKSAEHSESSSSSEKLKHDESTPGSTTGSSRYTSPYPFSEDLSRSTSAQEYRNKLGKSSNTPWDPSRLSPHSFGSINLDPFASYPIVMNQRTMYLVSQMFSEAATPAMLMYRDVWYPISINGPAPFHQMLASLATLINSLKIGGDDGDNLEESQESVIHHAKALYMANEGLAKGTNIGEQIITAVLSFVCYGHLTFHMDQWKLHMNGFRRILMHPEAQRKLKEDTLFRQMVSICDVIGSYALDVPPNFSMPDEIIFANAQSGSGMRSATSGNNFVNPINRAWRTIFADCSDMEPAFDQILSLFEDVRLDQLHLTPGRSHGYAVNCRLNPIVHIVLSYNPDRLLITNDDDLREVSRLAALLSLRRLRRESGAQPCVTHHLVTKLCAQLVRDDVDWVGMEPLFVWACCLAFSEVEDAGRVIWLAGRLKHALEQLKELGDDKTSMRDLPETLAEAFRLEHACARRMRANLGYGLTMIEG